MKKPITSDNAYMRLAALCARCEQAEGDLRKRLHDWGLSDTSSAAVIQRLKQERYLDNERFARAYCRDKLRFNGWGRIKISFMLRGKGIEQEYIDAALSEIDDDQYAAILDDALAAKARTLAVGFTITKNVTASNGTRNVYVRITTPEGETLHGGGTFEYAGKQLAWSMMKAIEYTGEETSLTLYWPVNEYLGGGQYNVSIFCDGQAIGSRTFTFTK